MAQRAQKVENPAKVFFFVESGGGETGRLCMSLDHDDPDDMHISVDSNELTLLQGLYAFAPAKFRRLMNNLVDEAYQAGFRHGTEDAEANEAVLMSTQS